VGLRPYRKSGFVVKREQMDDKTVIHNYGHGGGGISLSWGSSALATRLALGLPVGEAAVIGSGVMGLTTSRLLQDAGWKVTIYTRDVLRHSTSNVAAGHWSPTSVFDESAATPAFEAQFKFAARISHHAFQNLAGADYGIHWIENYDLANEPIKPTYYMKELPDLYPGTANLGPDEHPFPFPYVKRTLTMIVHPAHYLRRIRADFYRAGGRLVIQNFNNRDEVLALNEPVIFNCTGLGAGELFGDEELGPIKGQLVFLPPDPAVDYCTIGGGSSVLYMFPRKGEILLGGTYGHGDWTMAPDPAETDRIITEHQHVFSNLS
jgi:glycine/D-amino acid oxidase-like deaminating enzyme